VATPETAVRVAVSRAGSLRPSYYLLGNPMPYRPEWISRRNKKRGFSVTKQAYILWVVLINLKEDKGLLC
jgi:hypothetical protein